VLHVAFSRFADTLHTNSCVPRFGVRRTCLNSRAWHMHVQRRKDQGQYAPATEIHCRLVKENGIAHNAESEVRKVSALADTRCQKLSATKPQMAAPRLRKADASALVYRGAIPTPSRIYRMHSQESAPQTAFRNSIALYYGRTAFGRAAWSALSTLRRPRFRPWGPISLRAITLSEHRRDQVIPSELAKNLTDIIALYMGTAVTITK
jgi:hypothetical protein